MIIANHLNKHIIICNYNHAQKYIKRLQKINANYDIIKANEIILYNYTIYEITGGDYNHANRR